jgi:Protein of unknown function (DUF2914)
MQAALQAFWLRLNRLFPAIAFFGGFLWDAMTLGLSIGPLDLLTLAAYLAGAAGILWWLARQSHRSRSAVGEEAIQGPGKLLSGATTVGPPRSGFKAFSFWMANQGPYFALQFCFGGLFSALFIFYFKSSSHLSAYLVVGFLALLLIANEFLDEHYERFTLTWTLFGICSILLLNFIIPHILGSLHPFWFYFSTLLGAGLALTLRYYAPGRPGKVLPIAIVTVAWILSFWFDIIPPVPLVKKHIAVGQKLDRADNLYRIRIEPKPWYAFWRHEGSEVHMAPGSRLYCLSSVFAPKGMQTKLYHQWSFKDPKHGWKQVSRVGFPMNGGRENGYRGYSYKQSPQSGEWKVEVQSVDGRTVCRHEFTVVQELQTPVDSLPVWEM